MILHFCRNINARRDKTTMLNTLTIIGVWNINVLYLAAPIPINLHLVSILLFFYQPPNKGVDNFAFFVGTWFEERINQVYLSPCL